MKNLLNVFSRSTVAQNAPLPGTTQVENNAGGFVWELDDWQRLDRFLVLGSEGGTYYVSERKLTLDTIDFSLLTDSSVNPIEIHWDNLKIWDLNR